ncbi:hypothetical protein GCM10011428_28410 [Streptomyces violaceus]
MVSETEGAALVSVTLVRRTGAGAAGGAAGGGGAAGRVTDGGGGVGGAAGRWGGHGRCPGRGRLLRFVHRDAVLGGQPFEPAAVALPHGAELPGTLTAVELAQHESGFTRGARVVEAGHRSAPGGVLDLDVQVRDLPEGAAVGGGGEDDRLDRGLHAREVDEERVGHPAVGVPLALVTDRAGGVRGLVVKDEVRVGTHLPAYQQQSGGVRVGTPGPVRQPNSTRSAVVGTGVFEPFSICMSAPIAYHRARHIPAVRRVPSAQPIPPRRELPCAATGRPAANPW